METELVKTSFVYFQNVISKQFFPLVRAVFQHPLTFNTNIEKRVDNFALRRIFDDPVFFVSITSDDVAIAALVLFSIQTSVWLGTYPPYVLTYMLPVFHK
jgi:hypothetical protein